MIIIKASYGDDDTKIAHIDQPGFYDRFRELIREFHPQAKPIIVTIEEV